jgi:hypothetical protein
VLGEGAARPVGRDHHRRAHLVRCPVRIAPAHAGDPVLGDVPPDGAEDRRALDEPGAGVDRAARDGVIEDAAGRGGPPRGPVVELGPRQLHDGVAAVDAQAPLGGPAVDAAVSLVDQAEVEQLAHDPWRQPVTADLVPWEGVLLEQQHVATAQREVRGRGRATGARADHDDVGALGTGSRDARHGGTLFRTVLLRS